MSTVLAADAIARVRESVRTQIVPCAAEIDRNARMPAPLLQALAREGWFGWNVPAEFGGAAYDLPTCGRLHAEVGRGCGSVRAVLTAHQMVSHALLRWGSGGQQRRWLPTLASGGVVGALALTEPDTGTDAASIASTVRKTGGRRVLNGRKQWITSGQIAGLFLVFARCEEGTAAVIVPRESPGVRVEPMGGLLGLRGAMLAAVELNDVEVDDDELLGPAGGGVTHVAGHALEYGRLMVAWGCAAIIETCLEVAYRYAARRIQFGKPIAEHQLIRRLLSDMTTDARAGRLLCESAACLRDAGSTRATLEILAAKYFCASAAGRAARSAVQILGANGCTDAYPVERLLRDSKIMEIIEGSSELHQIEIARYAPDAFDAAS